MGESAVRSINATFGRRIVDLLVLHRRIFASPAAKRLGDAGWNGRSRTDGNTSAASIPSRFPEASNGHLKRGDTVVVVDSRRFDVGKRRFEMV